MKKYLTILPAALLCAALAAPLQAQDEDLYGGETHSESVSKAKEKAPAPAKAAKPAAKKPKKKKRVEPVSEYKFKTESITPTYKFDKKADPILKPSKKKKSSGGGSAAGSGAGGVPKLKPVKSLNAPEEKEGGAGGAADLGGIKLPPGMNIPGMGGK